MIPSRLKQILSFSLLMLMLFAPSWVQAQRKGSPERMQIEADELFSQRKYEEAETLYKAILDVQPDHFHSAFRLGRINYRLRDYQESLKYYRKAGGIDPNRNDMVYFRIGVTYKVLNNYRLAKENLNEFLRRHNQQDDYRERAELEIKGCALAEASISERPHFRVKEATFNSSSSDFFPAYLDQRQTEKYIVIASHRPRKKKSKRFQGLGEADYSDFYKVVLEDDSTFGDEVINMGKPINTKYNDGSASFTGDGLTMYYAISNTKKASTSIYETRYNPIKKRWAKPRPVEGINGSREKVINARGKTQKIPTFDTHPYITKDGRTLFFCSDRDGGFGGIDIWFARRVGNGWSDPINAGEAVNSPFNEYTPFLSDNGSTLFFASNGHAGFGGFDIYKAEGELGNWQAAINLGQPLNSSYDDWGSIWMSEDSSVIFTSDRPGGAGLNDIYWGRAIPYKEPPVEVTLQGKVRNKITKEPIAFAIAILYELTDGAGDIMLDTFKTDQSARFQFNLEPGKKYRVVGNAPDYFADHVDVEAPEESADLERNVDIDLDPIELGKPIVIQNIYYDFDEAYLRPDAVVEMDSLLYLLSLNSNITIQLGSHTDSNGPRAYNKKLSNKRARTAVYYLVTQGIDPGRLYWFGYGKDQPLIQQEMTAADEQANRRTEFRVMRVD